MLLLCLLLSFALCVARCPLHYLRSIRDLRVASTMASHHSTIAKATFAASLLRPDVTKVSRDELQDFHTFFESTATKGSSSNIQVCHLPQRVNVSDHAY